MNTFIQAIQERTAEPPTTSDGPNLVSWLIRVVVALAIGVMMLPVLLLPFVTAVPAPVWIVLMLADVLLIGVLLRLTHNAWQAGAVLVGFVVVSLFAVWTSQFFAATPPITDAQGSSLPNSIATLEKVNLNRSEQWITIRGKDVNNPVLLYLGAGGPGAGDFATRQLFTPLEDHYTIVSWDEPGTGKSYDAVPIRSLTPQRYVEDAHALTQLLRERFHQDKIYVYGVSWTSILGIWLVQQYPQDYYAYVGNAQMVNTTENDVMGYELALHHSMVLGDTATVKTLRRNGPPPYMGDGLGFKYLAYLDVLNDYMGAPRYSVLIPLMPLFAPEYGLLDKLNHTRGLVESFEMVYPQLQNLELRTQANKLEVPIYFFAGRDDVNAFSSLVEDYYNVLQAPHKELIWFEEAGHGLNAASMAQFVDAMVNKVLAETQPNWLDGG